MTHLGATPDSLRLHLLGDILNHLVAITLKMEHEEGSVAFSMDNVAQLQVQQEDNERKASLVFNTIVVPA